MKDLKLSQDYKVNMNMLFPIDKIEVHDSQENDINKDIADNKVVIYGKKDFNHGIMNIPSAWEKTKGKHVKVVTLDTGLPKHWDLKVVKGKSFINNYLEDTNGHATHVCGTICALKNTKGTVGIAPEVELYTGTVLNASGSGTIESIIKAIYWSVDEVGAHIINMSLGIQSQRVFPELEKACRYAYDNNVLVVCASGNSASFIGQPALYDSTIAVGAIDRNIRRVNFSNFGEALDFVAVGHNIYSTWLNNRFATLSGTSMAAPAITGVCALILSGSYKQLNRWLTVPEVYDEIKRISFRHPGKEFDNYKGWGIPVFNMDKNIKERNTVVKRIINFFKTILRLR